MNTQGIDRQSIEEATQEASQRPMDFNPAERAKDVRTMLDDIPPHVRRGATQDELKTRFTYYAEKYPELYKKIITKQDLTPIRTMLSMLDKMAEGSITQHQASIIVGQRLVDRFVKPQLNGNGQDRQGH